MDIQEFAVVIETKNKQLQEFIRSQAVKDIVGTEAVAHFKGSFENEGFTDETLNPWKEVERRKPESPWYGHSGQTSVTLRTSIRPYMTRKKKYIKRKFKIYNG